MALTLRVTSFHNQALGADATRVFGPEGGSIGRSMDNDWVLPDPEKFVSSYHAEIVCRGDTYALRDISTNGTYINGAPQPVGNNAEHQLVNGDQIQIAEYVITVALEAAQQPSVTGPAGAGWTPPGVSTGAPVVPPVAATDDIVKLFDSPSPSPPPGPQGPFSDHASALDQNIVPPQPEFPPLPGIPPQPQQAPMGDTNVIPSDYVPGLDETTFEPFDDLPPAEPDPVAQPAPSPAAQQPPPAAQQPPPTPPSAAAAPGGDQQAIVAMLMGAGLDQANAQAAATPENLSALGEILGITTQGLIDVLTARSEVKSQFRVPMTMMRPVENNALKSSANAAEALLNLLVIRNPAYLSAVDSFAEGFSDIKAHQMALMAGMRAAFDSMLERFDPEELEQRFKKLKSKSMLRLPGGSQNWEMYKDQYTEMTQDADANFQRLFGEEFARAYEEQMQLLTAARGRMKV